MPRRARSHKGAFVIVVALAFLTSCGTRVDESSTPQTILVPVGGGGATGTTIAGVDGLAAGGVDGLGTAGPGGASSTGGGGGAAGTPAASGGTGGVAAARACPGGATGDPIQLGSVGTRSGIVGAALENAFRGLVVWQEWVNSRGGIQCRPVKITITDGGIL